MAMLSPMKKWLSSLSVKILFAYVLGVVLSIALFTAGILWLLVFQTSFLASADIAEFTEKMSHKLLFDQYGSPQGFEIKGDNFSWVFESLRQEAAYRVLDEVGNPVLMSAAGLEFWPKRPSASNRLIGPFEFKRNDVLFHSATASTTYNGSTWYVQFAASNRFFYFMHRSFALPFMGWGILLFSLVLLCVFGACAYITLRYTLKPLRKASEAAANISPQSLHTRLSVECVPTEIVPLIKNFNHVLDRLEKSFRIQQEFLATAAHELKTPLALIRAQTELQKESADRDALLNDVMHMTRQVQQLLLLAEVSEFQNYHFRVVDINAVAREVIDFLAPMTNAANVKVTLAYPQTVEWFADRAALFTLLKNLLENAIQHAPQDSEIVILVNAVELAIRDHGPGIAEEDLHRIFDRFWRGVHRRDHGSGLGLTICKEIATAHGWHLSAERAEPGLCIRLLRESGVEGQLFSA